MPRDITITFSDGTKHQYNNTPDSVTPDDIENRAKKDYPTKKISNISGGKKKPAGDPLSADPISANARPKDSTEPVKKKDELDQVKKNAGVDTSSAKILTRPGDKGKYTIVSSKKWSKDPEVTIVLNSRLNADKTTSYTVRGINVKNNTTYDLPAGSRNTSDDLNVMKQIFNSEIELSGPFPITNSNTIQGMLRDNLPK
jgi:hypothetical protein